MPLSGLRAADLGRIWPMGLGKPCRDEHADGIEAEVVRPEQHVVGRVGLAEGRAQLPLVGSQQLADPLAPVAAEHRLLRSEERRVGKVCRATWSEIHEKSKV